MFVASPLVGADRARTQIPVSVTRRERTDTGARLTRYRGGTYSSTVETVIFADGTSARTDLIRLNPNAVAYSLDFSAAAPTRPAPYRAAAWSALPNPQAHGFETEVDWILRNSFPSVGTAELSRRLRAAGYVDAVGNIAEHEAIAATQAAIWFFTNDLQLDNRPLNVPVRTQWSPGAIIFEFDGTPQLGGYTVELGGQAVVELEKSVDGHLWQPVPASGLEATEAGQYRKTLGVGATTSKTRSGGRGVGYRFYRLVATEGRLDDADVSFWLQGTGHHRNADRIVHLYDYLLAGARWAARRASAPELSTVSARVIGDRVGPFRLHADHPAELTAANGLVVDVDGVPLVNVEPGAQFWLQPFLGADDITVTATVAGGRLTAGVAANHEDGGLTPVVLTRPVPMVVDFQLRWRNTLYANAIRA